MSLLNIELAKVIHDERVHPSEHVRRPPDPHERRPAIPRPPRWARRRGTWPWRLPRPVLPPGYGR